MEADHLAADYGLGPVCAPVSFSLMQGERLALTGRNGTGKSSLLRLVCGEELPHTGTLSLASGLVVSVAPQDPSFLRGDLTSFAAESGIDETLFKTILRKLDFSRSQFEKDMAGYSAGQKKKVLLARSLCQSAHLYVWDEPLNCSPGCSWSSSFWSTAPPCCWWSTTAASWTPWPPESCTWNGGSQDEL